MTTSRFEQYRQSSWFGSLDGLRCISVLAVVFHHTVGEHFGGSLAHAGTHGVSLFFAISGFLITTLLLRERARHGTISLRDFYIRRSLRIFPLYYTVILVYVAVVLVLERDPAARQGFFENLPYFLTYTSNWFVDLESGERVIFYFAWSLATEEQFYLLWPSIERRVPRAAVAIVLVLVVVAVLARLDLTPLVRGSFAHTVVASFAPAIGLGVALAHLLDGERGFAIGFTLLGHPVAAPTALVLSVTAILLEAPEIVVFVMLTALVGTCVIREDNGLSRVLRWRPMVMVGTVSYGIYLLHMLVLNAVRRGLGATSFDAPPLVVFVLTSVLAFAVAWVSFHGYERRFLALKSRFVR